MAFITFDHLRAQNEARCKLWHPINSWSTSDWGVAMAGEVGEVCNIIKKMNRHRDRVRGNKGEDLMFDTLLRKIGHEMVDTAIYMDLLAASLNIDLGVVIIDKFNIVSEEQNMPQRLIEGR